MTTIPDIDLTQEIDDWKNAKKGKEVRKSNIRAFEKIQGSVNHMVETVNAAAKNVDDAAKNAQAAVDNVDEAIKTATDKASEAAEYASEAAEYASEAAEYAAAGELSKKEAATQAATATSSAARAESIAAGFDNFDGTAKTVNTIDTYGMVVDALGETTAQALVDAIASRVMTELMEKNKLVNNLLATDPTTVLAGTMGKQLAEKDANLQEQVTQLNGESSAKISNSALSDGSMTFFKKAGIVYLNYPYDITPTAAGASLVLGKLPDGFRPRILIRQHCALGVGLNQIAIRTDGTVEAYCHATGLQSYRYCISYLAQ